MLGLSGRYLDGRATFIAGAIAMIGFASGGRLELGIGIGLLGGVAALVDAVHRVALEMRERN